MLNNSTGQILKKDTKFIKGVGESRAMLLSKIGLFTLEDVLYHFPRCYEDRSSLKKINQLQEGEETAFEGVVFSEVAVSRPRRGLAIYKLFIKDDTGRITATWYNRHYIKNTFHPGEEYIFYGRIRRKYYSLEIMNPVYEKAEVSDKKHTCKIIPIYPSTADLAQNVLKGIIAGAVEAVDGKLSDIIPMALRLKYSLAEFNYSIKNIHFPSNADSFESARRRLVFEELLLLQLGLLMIKQSGGSSKKGITFKDSREVGFFIEKLPFRLTNAQIRVFREIERDMESDMPMNRLVQGDVGSGKTIVAVLAILKAVKSGYQAAMMAPTEILAAQHYCGIAQMFEPYGIKVTLLTGSVSRKGREAILEDLSHGNIEVLIGTHALIQDGVAFERLGLVITDEQHRFGVRQRALLSQKTENPDVLVMTATPIPRTLALILYGDLDISVIDELPQGRKKIETYVVEEGMRNRIESFIKKQVQGGRQAYIVCPLVEESEEIEAKSAVEYALKLKNDVFSGLNIGLIYGKMPQAEKEQIMRRFVEGGINILVSTTVIEVGVNVPNSTLMVIENAERFGLAQLHQLRGRVGRGSHQSYCILFNCGKSKESREKMQIMQKTDNGFVISEKDLELRGTGEFFGTRQHGLPELKIANLYSDMDILNLAQEAAIQIMKEDPKLEREENQRLKQKIEQKLLGKTSDVSMN